MVNSRWQSWVKKNFSSFFPALLIIIFIAAVAINQKTEEKNPQKEAVVSAKLGWQWLKNYDGKFLDPGNIFVIKKINDKFCGSNEKIEKFWKKIWEKEFENHSYLSAFERLFSGGNDYKISEKVIGILNDPQETYDNKILQALYCDLYPVKKNLLKEIFGNMEKETDYALTHKFWMAILLKENGCGSENYDIDKNISMFAKQIAEEQEKNKEVDDLYAERTAFLINFGFKNYVKDEYIKELIKNQKPSGVWTTPTFFSKDFENPHTTALALWTLAEYSQTCPF